MPRIVACGGRGSTFSDFATDHASGATPFVAMLIDSETPVQNLNQPWQHLNTQAQWTRPHGALDDQALLMVTSMESWISADRGALRRRFGSPFSEAGLPAVDSLETRTPAEVLDALRHATRHCKAKYEKGALSFEVLGLVSPTTLSALPSFARLERVLKARLPQSK